MSQLLSNLPVGALVKDTNTKYNNEAIIWQVLEHGHTGDPTGTTALCSRDIITLKCFDAKEPNNSDDGRKSYGNNRYLHSNILQWLNSDATNWYTAQHNADQAPDSSNVWADSGTPINPYDTEKGFLANFSEKLKTALQTVTKVTGKNDITDGGGSENVNSKIFLLSRTEVGLDNGAEGSIYKYYQDSNTNDRRKKNLANDAAKGNYNSATSPLSWWLRTPRFITSHSLQLVGSGGTLVNVPAYYGDFGVAPAMCIPSTAIVSDTTDSDGAYTLIFNSSPTITTTTSLGTKYYGFSTSYTVSDEDADTVSLSVTLDGTEIYSTASVTLDVAQTLTISDSLFDSLPYGSHNLVFTVNNGTASNSVTATFTSAAYNIRVVGSEITNPITSYSYSINSIKARKRFLPFDVAKATLTVPTVSGSYTYDGTQKSATITGFDSNTMTKSGDETATNAGTYTVTFGLVDSNNYQWNSSTTSFVWTIAKTTSAITVSSASVSPTNASPTKTVTVENQLDRTLSVSSSDTSVAIASISGTTVTITGLKSGSATVTVSAAESSNCFASNATVSVSANIVDIVTFADGTDTQIKAMLDAYYADEITWTEMGWAVGDTRKIHLNAMSGPTPTGGTWAAQDITVVIVAHDHTDLTTAINGHTKACITVQTRECMNNNTSGANQTGHIYVNGDSSYDSTFTKWSNLYMRTYMNSTVLDAIPLGDFKSAIRQSKHYRATYDNTTDANDELVTDTLFLPSIPEIFGTDLYYSSYYKATTHTEGTQFAYYADSSKRVKYGNNNGVSNGIAQYWWVGSCSRTNYASQGYYYYWLNVAKNGRDDHTWGNESLGLAPAFVM